MRTCRLAGQDLTRCRERADSCGLVDAPAGVAVRRLRCRGRVNPNPDRQGEAVLASVLLQCALDLDRARDCSPWFGEGDEEAVASVRYLFAAGRESVSCRSRSAAAWASRCAPRRKNAA
jgi:hypothetical protein